MAEQLIHSLKSSTTPTHTKLKLAQHAYESPTFIFPFKNHYLTEWTISIMFKSRTWSQQIFGTTPIISVDYWRFLATLMAHHKTTNGQIVKAPLFGLLMDSMQHLSRLPNDQMCSLFDPVAQCMDLFVSTCQHLMIKSQLFDPWIALLQTLMVLPLPAPKLAAFLKNAFTGYNSVFRSHQNSLAAYSNLCSNFHVFVRLLRMDYQLVFSFITDLFQNSFSNRDVVLDSFTAIVQSHIQLLSSAQASGLNAESKSKKRKIQNSNSSVNVFSADLSKSLHAVPAEMKNQAFVTLLQVMTSIVSTFNVESLLLSLPSHLQAQYSPSNPSAIIITPSLLKFILFQSLVTYLPSEESVDYTLVTDLWSVMAPQLLLSEDHSDMISGALNKAILGPWPSSLLQFQRFLVLSKISINPLTCNFSGVIQAYVDMIITSTDQQNFDVIDGMAELMDRFGNARILDVLFNELSRHLISQSVLISKVFANRSTLKLFISQLVKCPYLSWFPIANQLLTIFKSTNNAVIATYLSVMIEHIPLDLAFHTQRIEFANQIKLLVMGKINPNSILVHQAALVHVLEYQSIWHFQDPVDDQQQPPQLLSIIREASTSFPWMALPGILSGFKFMPSAYHAELLDLANRIAGLFTLQEITPLMTTEWSTLFWDLEDHHAHQIVYWWMTVVQDLDLLPILAHPDTLTLVGTIFTGTLGRTIPPVCENAVSIMSVSTRSLLSCALYEIEWLQIPVKRLFLADPNAIQHYAGLLTHFPATYFTSSERSTIARRIMAIEDPSHYQSNSTEVTQSWDSVLGHLALCLDLPVIPRSLDHAMRCIQVSEPTYQIRLGYLLIQRLLQVAHTDEERLALLGRLMRAPCVGSAPYLALRVILHWFSMERGTSSRAQVIAQVAEQEWNNSRDPVHVAFVYQVTGKQDTIVAPINLVMDTGFMQTYFSRVISEESGLDPLMISAIHSFLKQVEQVHEFQALYDLLLNQAPVPGNAGNLPLHAVGTWIAIVHVFTSVSKHQLSIRQRMQHTLSQISLVLESVSTVNELVSVLNLLECLARNVVRMSSQKLAHTLMVLTRMLGHLFADGFYTHVDPNSMLQAEKDSLFKAVVQVLDSILQFQRLALVKIPVVFTTLVQALLYSFLEPGRYAYKTEPVSNVEDPSCAKNTIDQELGPATPDCNEPVLVPMALLARLAPMSESSANAWYRLIQNIQNLPVPVLVLLKGQPTAQAVTPIAKHLMPILVEYMQWRTMTVPSSHPRFGWVLSSDDRVRAVLLRGVFEVLDLVGYSGRAYVLNVLPKHAKQAFKEIVVEYGDRYQYKGKV